MFVSVHKMKVSIHSYFKEFLRDFLGPVVKNPPANAGDVQFPGPGTKIPCAMEQLSPCTTNTDGLCILQPVLCNKKSHRYKKPDYCN